ncbi:MAG: NfeD family protein [Lachnospiraceae bacterium]|nr:NfeD family protein [Lachnospiraceae bacterium]
MAIIIWLVIAALLVIVEIATMGLTTIWFAGGAIVAALAAIFEAHWLIQFLVFAVVSLVLLIFTRPIATKHLMKDQEKTNVESLVGQSALVTATINNIKGEGTVKINGLEWTARSKNDTVIEEGSEVIIDSVSGVKLIVESK